VTGSATGPALHPQTRAYLARIGDADTGITAHGDWAAARAGSDRLVAEECGAGVDVAAVRDLSAEVPGGHGVPCRLYDPRDGGGAPVVLYLHGGGWATGGLQTTDALCRRIADRSGCAVLSVDYRLAPEHPWPAAVTDAETAVRWLRDAGGAHGVDGTRLALAGDSAGGNLAAVLARRLRDAGTPVALQALIYPVTDAAMDTGSYRAFGRGYGMTAEDMAHFWSAYLPPEADRAHPDASPARAGDLAGLPPALVLTAECDVLRDEGERYGWALAEAGTPATVVRYPGVVHGFARKFALFGAAYAAADQVAAAARSALE
jgi:acetyl esterase